MFAIKAGKVTCAGPDCSQPGTVPVTYAMPPTSTPRGDGTDKIIEHVVTLEYCGPCVERLELLAACGKQPVWSDGGERKTEPGAPGSAPDA